MAGQVELGWQLQVSTEVRPWAIDLSPELDSGDVPGAATSSLTDLLTGASYPSGLAGDPAVVGSVVTQAVQSLLPGHNYRLVITVAMGGAKETATALLISVPY